ncbi:fluoride efflux transporter FluC [Sphingomonas antarctica]|uniref:fluoride efflux transporter FluC n=1 Tax=Sphingomonas antarctica TaxID=2040274 RepID=UPI0039EC32CA
MPNLLLVMLGGALGSGARYLAVSRFTAPWGTLAVNLLGGLLMGALVGGLMRTAAGNEQARLLLGVGVLGGFTTFSAFSLDSWFLIERGQVPLALTYIGLSVAGSIVALGAGLMLVRAA